MSNSRVIRLWAIASSVSISSDPPSAVSFMNSPQNMSAPTFAIFARCLSHSIPLIAVFYLTIKIARFADICRQLPKSCPSWFFVL